MFRLARMSLANRALVALATVAVFVVGVASTWQLRQELIPPLDVPVVAVTAADPGTAPELLAEQVTEPVENAVEAVDGVTGLTSTVATGLSVTTVELEYGTDVDAAEQEITSALNGLSDLPEGVEPEVLAGSIDDFPVVQLAVSREGGGESDAQELGDLLDDVLVPELSGIADVRDVTVTGATERQVVVEPDAEQLAAAGLTQQQLMTLLEQNGTVLPVGSVTEDGTTSSVQVGTTVASVEDLEDLPLLPAAPAGAGAAGTPDDRAPGAGTDDETAPPETPGAAAPVVHLGDVAEVRVEDVPATSFSRLDGEPSLAVALTKTPDGNTVDVSHAVHDVLADLDDELDAENVTAVVTFDQAPFIEESIEGLTTEGGLGLLFAVLVILVFLASLRATLVSAISIPLSLAVTFAAMNLTGYTLNILTLAAMTISIGRIVDDSIVVIENIKRHLSYGEDRVDAIVTAVREVGAAITASTVCTVAVFAPIALVGGMAGELFRPFAVTVAIAMGASLVVALVVVPVLAYWFIKGPVSAEDGAAVREAAEEKERRGVWQRAYVPSLAAALRRPVVTLGIAVALLAGTVALVPRMETNFIGDAGQDTLSVTQELEPGTSLEAQDDAAREVEDVLAGVDGVATVQTTVGSGDGFAAAFGGGGGTSASFALALEEDADGTTVQDDVDAALEDADLAGELSVTAGDAGFASSTVDLVVTAPDADDLTEAAGRVEDAVTDVDGVGSVTNNLAAEQSTVRVTVDRDAAAAAGLTEQQVSGLLAGAMNAASLGTIDVDGATLDVVLGGDVPAGVDEIRDLDVPTAAGAVPLSDLAEVERVSAPASLTRVDGERSATVAVTPAGDDLGTLSRDLQAELDGLDLPGGAEVEVGGVAADQADAFADLGLALLVAILIVYLVMVATFRSIGQPLILLVSVPFAATGALGALLVTGTPLDVAALIGVLMLVGIVVSNAIVLIDLINQYRADGRTLDEAVREGARQRLRPIVMTAAATILALTPMAFGLTGGGAFISQPLALVVIGGLLSSTLLTLYVVPVIYTLLERRSEHRGSKRAARAARRAERAQAKAAEASRRAQLLATEAP